MRDFSTKHDFRKARPRCPKCRKKLTAASGGSRQPAVGDLSVCIYCGELLKFTDDDGHLASLPAAEFLALPADIRVELLRIMRAVEILRERGVLPPD